MNQFEFVKSSYSGDQANSECVEVATNVAGTVAIRDSKLRSDGPVIRVTDTAWAAFAGDRAAFRR
ncbi:DUF397 domain-containing protein [Streptomyces sp. NBC_00091]|uniref:DUF397 domain-containing protein n=1 Tax=Streptomyces sp. NBC_00091 TaxID=2975648 RepID=UPI00225704D9|nr:DUF397 domain-containing protein [Streptomyces sp. NBC_00091]MCX5377291.1 DUF397 domain-containing protein [Streptomyces sp. NBC_00091]